MGGAVITPPPSPVKVEEGDWNGKASFKQWCIWTLERSAVDRYDRPAPPDKYEGFDYGEMEEMTPPPSDDDEYGGMSTFGGGAAVAWNPNEFDESPGTPDNVAENDVSSIISDAGDGVFPDGVPRMGESPIVGDGEEALPGTPHQSRPPSAPGSAASSRRGSQRSSRRQSGVVEGDGDLIVPVTPLELPKSVKPVPVKPVEKTKAYQPGQEVKTKEEEKEIQYRRRPTPRAGTSHWPAKYQRVLWHWLERDLWEQVPQPSADRIIAFNC